MTTSTSVDIPVRRMDLQYGCDTCTKAPHCDKFVEQFRTRMVGRYVGHGRTFSRQIPSSILDLNDVGDFDTFIARARTIHKGNAVREAQKAHRSGLYCKQFVWKNHIPDIVDINTSKQVRSGGRMKDAYQRSVEELGGPPSLFAKLSEPACLHHCVYSWGIFQAAPGHRQGDVQTDERLLGYIKFKRQGSLGIYTSILGHGEFLNLGIMHCLHHAVIKWVFESPDRFSGVDCVLYGSHDPANSGLHMWKRRALFQPAYLVLDHIPEPESR